MIENKIKFQILTRKKSVIVFIERVPDVDNLYTKIRDLEPDFNPGFNKESKKQSKVVKITSFYKQQEREEALEKFHDGTAQILITTNVCSRGLNLSDTRVDVVINYTLPEWTDLKARQHHLGYGTQEVDFIHRLVGKFVRSKNQNSALDEWLVQGTKLKIVTF